VHTENLAARKGSCSEGDLSANGSRESSLKNLHKTKSATQTRDAESKEAYTKISYKSQLNGNYYHLL